VLSVITDDLFNLPRCARSSARLTGILAALFELPQAGLGRLSKAES
jgi:hypothetical protein